jgi:tetratricopeptide (TPR) repeat protein
MRSRLVFAMVAGLSSACAHPKAPAAPAPVGPSPTERLSAADALVREGCLDCLLDAFREYDALRANAAAAAPAREGLIHAAALIALRERELGIVDEGYLDKARQAASEPDAAPRAAELVDLIDVLAPAAAGTEVVPRRMTPAERSDRLSDLRLHADDDPLSAAAWVRGSCEWGRSATATRAEVLLEPLTAFRDAPLVSYEIALCDTRDQQRLTTLESAHPAFHEIEYSLALGDIGRIQLDPAEDHLTAALAWRGSWPSALVRLAAIKLTEEDFAGALELDERALALVPRFAQAMLGRVQALSELGRYEEAIARSSELLQTNNYPGDAYYWRAWNENALERLDAAWSDVEEAERSWKNSDVIMLAGLISYKRGQLEEAKSKFAGVLAIDAARCDALFYLAAVYGDLESWLLSADGYDAAALCLETARTRLAQEIERLQQSGGRPERVAQQVARREAERATALSMQQQSWFNGAVANLRLGRKDAARQLAEKLLDDGRFGERAREILAQAK